MAVTHADVLQPKGDLEPHTFPHLTLSDLQSRITEYLAAGVAKATALGVLAANHDAAAIAWAYYRCYLAIYQRLSATPGEATIAGQGSRRYDAKQAEAFLALANRWREEFEALVPADADLTPPGQPETASFTHRMAF